MAPLSCSLCSKNFTHKSSLVRHLRRCELSGRAPSRQKACCRCASTKVRCDLQRPACGRCQARSLPCEFVRNPPTGPLAVVAHPASSADGDRGPSSSRDATASSYASLDDSLSTRTTTPPAVSGSDVDCLGSHDYTPEGIPRELVISNERRQAILGTAPKFPSSDVTVRHTMHFVIRVLKSWPRLMAAHHTAQLPPPIHRLQVAEGVPTALANCYALAKMWAEHTDGSRELVKKTILYEIRRLLSEYTSYSERDLLGAAQSLLMMVIMLFFGMGRSAPHRPADAELLLQIWDVKHHLSRTGLLLVQETAHTTPPWREWAIVTAKRRTVHSFHQVEWAWSLLHGYPVLTCFELGPLPAPPAKHLWQETDERRWRELYAGWLRQWDGGYYKMMEFFHINPGGALDSRSEMWLAEADEYGMMVMAEVNAIGGA